MRHDYKRSTNPFLHIVLVNPEIPQNTGNVGRTCIGLGARLHLVGQLGFSLEDKYLKRAGLDYWPKIDLQVHKTWEDFQAAAGPHAEMAFLSRKGSVSLWDKEFKFPSYLVFGSESSGLPPALFKRHEKDLVRIPTNTEIRSLNLSTAVGVVAFEAARRYHLAKIPC